ncbi:hypothetical protein GJ496_001196 [Pomphorhynchus laevis]|nr:hypothetical protein GJ496_001196 [Pomphorhynchus laevis]
MNPPESTIDDNSKFKISKLKFKSYLQDFEVKVVESIHGSNEYCCRLWPSAIVLALYVVSRQNDWHSKTILELGAGTALPSLLLHKMGANVIMSDKNTDETLSILKEVCCQNELDFKDVVSVISWSKLSDEMFMLPKIDVLVGSDLFYDKNDILSTIDFFRQYNNEEIEIILAIEFRSSGKEGRFYALLKQYENLCFTKIDMEEFASDVDAMDKYGLSKSHDVTILKCICKNSLKDLRN